MCLNSSKGKTYALFVIQVSRYGIHFQLNFVDCGQQMGEDFKANYRPGTKIDDGTFNILEGAQPPLKRGHWGKCQRMKAVNSEILSGTTATSILQTQENKSGHRKAKDKHKGPKSLEWNRGSNNNAFTALNTEPRTTSQLWSKTCSCVARPLTKQQKAWSTLQHILAKKRPLKQEEMAYKANIHTAFLYCIF